MENPTLKTFKEAEEVLASAVQRKITISETCMMLDKNPDFMTGITGKIEKAYKDGKLKEKERDKLILLYSQYTRMVYNNKKKLKKSSSSNDKPSVRLTKGSKPSKPAKIKKVTKTKIKINSAIPIINEDNLVYPEDVINLSIQEQEMLEYNADTDEKYEERSIGEIIRGNDTFKNSHGDIVHKIA